MVAKLIQSSPSKLKSYPAALMDQLYGILDSKIQYQEFKINQAVKSYVDMDPLMGGASRTKEDFSFVPILKNNSRVLENIDSASHLIKLLFIIRKRLTHENAKLVLDLMSEKKFEHFTPEGLKDYFDRPWIRKTEIA